MMIVFIVLGWTDVYKLRKKYIMIDICAYTICLVTLLLLSGN